MNGFNKILTLCERQHFLKKSSSSANELGFLLKIGPTGAMLQEKLRNELLQHFLANKDTTVFLCSDNDFEYTFNVSRQMCSDTLPFGIVQVTDQNNLKDSDKLQSDNINFQHLFEDDKKFKCTMFVPPRGATQFFHQWQRQRKMWWRKISASPGRYILKDIKTNEQSQFTEITATYPWGKQLLETITSNVEPKMNNANLHFKDGRKLVEASSVETEVSCSTMLLNILCDAFDERGSNSQLFRFHRKLAPYFISFSVSASQKVFTDELNQLALYLCKQLRKNFVSSLLLPGSVKCSLEVQLKQYDELGIPFNVLLNERTLKDGIFQLRSRDTTLKEQVHVTKLASYVEMLLKNY